MRKLFLLLEFWNYSFHPMRMTNVILPRHTSQGTIKGNTNHVWLLFFFPPCWQKGKTSRQEREHFSLYPGTIPTADWGTFHLERAHFNICSSASFRRPFPCQLFLSPKTKWTPKHLAEYKIPAQPFTTLLYLLWLTAQGKTSTQAVIKLQNWKLSISALSLFIFFLLI